MVFDIERHEQNKVKFLATLYEMTVENERYKASRNPRNATAFEHDILERAKIEGHERTRIGNDLFDAGLLRATRHDNARGNDFYLTDDGFKVAERCAYESSTLATRRKARRWLSNQFKTISASVWSNLASGFGGLAAGWILREYRDVMAGIVKRIFGH